MVKQTTLLPEEKCFESNTIARSAWRTENVWVQRVAAILISKISPEDEKFAAHDIPISDIVGDGRAGSSYRTLRDNLGKALMAQVVLLYNDVENPDDFVVHSVFKDGIRYLKKKDAIRIALNPALAPYYLELKKNFTVYGLTEFLSIRGTYAQTLFRFLKSWESEDEHTEPIDRLHLMLNTPPTLQRSYTKLDSRALAPAHRNITENTDLQYTYEPVKQGRKVVAVRFKFKSKPKFRKAPPGYKQS